MQTTLVAEVSGQPVNGNGSLGVTTWQAVALALADGFWAGIMAVIAVGGTAYLAINRIQIPEILSNLDIAIIGFYFLGRGQGPISIGGKK